MAVSSQKGRVTLAVMQRAGLGGAEMRPCGREQAPRGGHPGARSEPWRRLCATLHMPCPSVHPAGRKHNDSDQQQAPG